MIKLQNGDRIPRAFDNDAVPVCFSANNSYVPQTAVMIKSIIANSIEGKNYDFIILSTDIDEKNEQILADFIEGRKNISIRIYDISALLDDVTFYTDSVYTPTTYSKEAYFRLFIPFAMPDYETVVYFDGDMTVASDISSVMDIDMTGYIAAATRDYCGIAACYDTGSDRLNYRKEIGIKNPDDYFISSMVLVNVKRFRELYELSDIKKMISSRNWRQHDQDIFNVLCQDEILIVGAEWSFFEEFDYSLRWLPENLKAELLEAQKRAIVIHYAGANKAWMDDNSALTRYFWEHAAKTPYFEEFYKKIPDDKVSYKYHIFKNVLKQPIDYFYTHDDVVVSSNHFKIGSLGQLKVCVEFLNVKYDVVTVEGWYEYVDLLGEPKLYALHNGVGIPVENGTECRLYANRSQVKKIRPFKATVWLDKDSAEHKLEFGFTYDDIHFIRPHYLSVEQFAPINEHPDSFYSCSGYILTKIYGTTLRFEPHSRKKVLAYNKKLCKFLASKKDKYFEKMAAFRWLYYLTKPLYRSKNIWLISDTADHVDEKTLGFFDYLTTVPGVEAYLVVDGACDNLNALRGRKNVVVARTKKHKFLYFHSKVVLASDYNTEFFMPAYDRANEIRDIVANKKFVYWKKHEEDLSYNVRPWYNIHKFILNNKDDYEMLLQADNGYGRANLCVVDNQYDGRFLYQDVFTEICEDENECK